MLEPASRVLDAGVVERRVTVAQKLREDAREHRVVGFEQPLVVRAHVILAHVGQQHAERREVRRQIRHDHGRNLQVARDLHGVQRTGAADRDEREVARIVAALDRDAAHGERHLGDGDLHDAVRDLGRVHAQRLRRASLEPAPRGVDVERASRRPGSSSAPMRPSTTLASVTVG